MAKEGAEIIVVGPTASILPDAFFRRGIKKIGSVAVTKPDELLDILAEAGSGYHFYEKSASKIVIEKMRVHNNAIKIAVIMNIIFVSITKYKN